MKNRLITWLGLTLVSQGLFTLERAAAQNLAPNAGFEAGTGQPAGWRLAAGQGQWSGEARQGARCLRADGNGNDQAAWHSDELALGRDRLYRWSFYARRGPGGGGGSAVAGTSRVNRDFGLGETWSQYSFVFSMPADEDRAFLRLGQWHLGGTARFDDVELTPVAALHQRLGGGLELGSGEAIEGGRYRCEPDLNGEGANYHRTLLRNRAGFNSNRWLFQPGAEVVYRHALPGLRQKEARVRVAINYYESGALKIEASRDGREWRELKTLGDKDRAGDIPLPADLFPAPEIQVRLSCGGAGGNLQVDQYRYEAGLADPAAEAEGHTYFFEIDRQDPGISVELRSFNPPGGVGPGEISVAVANRTAKAVELSPRWREAGKALSAGAGGPWRVEPGAAPVFTAPLAVAGAGDHELELVLADPQDRPVFSARTHFRLGFLSDGTFGHPLTGTPELGLWWCESQWKVGRDRGLPPGVAGQAPPAGLSLRLARNEFEAAQLVLRPHAAATLNAVKLPALKDRAGRPARLDFTLYEVAYVKVTHPTDATGGRDSFPDPLPPLRTPLPLSAGRNQPLWVEVKTAPECEPGEYQGELELETSLGICRVPIQVQVYGFALPVETHLRSALGLGTGYINQYHRLKAARDQESVHEKYLQNFADHRISPYSFFPYAPIGIRFEGEGEARHAVLDFTRFDQAAGKWLKHFNSFQLPLRGMGGGTFHSRHLGELEGFKEGTAGHARLFQSYLSQIEKHLRENGWLGAAFTYWFDEPDPKDYEFVVDGMKRIKAAAPGIKRLLTEQPEPQLQGHVEIWCGLTPEWSREKVAARKAAGEEVWWYICCAPKAPYVTEFIDHPGTELRLWPWQSWQYGVTGILIWETLYWTSDLVFPPPKLQNPWADPMSYVTGYGNPVGHVAYWGNGDGRFLYPPRRDPDAAQEPCLEAPINSVRWENLRDGMEDYEYFWLLRQAIERAGPGRENLVEQARKLLEIPGAIATDLTHFTTQPGLILEHRHRVAQMIEKLAQ